MIILKIDRRNFVKIATVTGAGIITWGLLPSFITDNGCKPVFLGKCTFDEITEKLIMNRTSEYQVIRLKESMKIDGNWYKPQWEKVEAIDIINFMGKIPEFCPVAKAKMMYDDDNLYLIFRVQDRFVRCITNEHNGPVWEDSCVEFFFSPDSSLPLLYFNLEINCGGTPLMRYNLIPRKKFKTLEIEDIKTIEIFHSLPEIIDPEIAEPVTWTIEYRIPISLLEKYTMITHPKPGISWRANFYKVAENTSNPHYMTWSVVDNPVPDFHLPQFFGLLKFL
jgi:hypothetical protein